MIYIQQTISMGIIHILLFRRTIIVLTIVQQLMIRHAVLQGIDQSVEWKRIKKA
ncbi:hypothetical protein [Lysinibacillus fusiformis]|uniref:hypothetical protein n=1 Tax=Lysinibacillus fusiformis TaxID=28031 RepID=UPI0021C07515|nr:hypothetical protein [Lysinibacillus fusiformis]UXJ70758.1 hypothetical protein N5069_09530 [Lysinibacillus fusiformis]